MRLAVEDAEGRAWALERLFPGQRARREAMGSALAVLADNGLPVAPYRRTVQGSFVAESQGSDWQLSPFVPGDPLPRPDYVDHPERGVGLGRFLGALHRCSADIVPLPDAPHGLEGYCRNLVATLADREPDLAGAVRLLLDALEPLWERWPTLDRGLVHGDLHPLNVIWLGRDVAAVLDWEFMARRPLLYDPANCLGCVGIEDPMALVRGVAPALIRTLGREGVLAAGTLPLLPRAVLALRFAWLSEWLRRRDREMVDLELAYMNILAHGLDDLARAWKGLVPG